jgi:hypothetical protein
MRESALPQPASCAVAESRTGWILTDWEVFACCVLQKNASDSPDL